MRFEAAGAGASWWAAPAAAQSDSSVPLGAGRGGRSSRLGGAGAAAARRRFGLVGWCFYTHGPTPPVAST